MAAALVAELVAEFTAPVTWAEAAAVTARKETSVRREVGFLIVFIEKPRR